MLCDLYVKFIKLINANVCIFCCLEKKEASTSVDASKS